MYFLISELPIYKYWLPGVASTLGTVSEQSEKSWTIGMKSVWMREKCMAVARLSGLLLFKLLYTETNEGGGEHAPNIRDTPQIEQDH